MLTGARQFFSLFRREVHLRTLLMAYGSLFCLGLCDNIRGPLYAETMASLNLNDAQGSYLWAMASGMCLIGSYLSGRLARRFNEETILSSALFLMGVGLVSMGLSQNFPFVLFFCGVFGIGLGFLGFSQNVLVLKAGPPHWHSRMQAGLHSQYGLSSLLAPLLVVAMSKIIPGWRFVYFFAGGLSMIGAAWCFYVRKPMAANLGSNEEWGMKSNQGSNQNFNQDSNEKANGESNLVSDRKPNEQNKMAGVHHFSPLAGVWLGLVLSFYVAIEILVSSRISLLVHRNLSLDLDQAGYYTFYFFIGLFLGRVVFIFWKPRCSLKASMTCSLFGTLVLMAYSLLWDARGLALTGFVMAPFYPLTIAYLAENFKHVLGRAMAMILALNSAMTVSMHLGVGILTKRYGIENALWLGPAGALLALTLLHTHHFSKKLDARDVVRSLHE